MEIATALILFPHRFSSFRRLFEAKLTEQVSLKLAGLGDWKWNEIGRVLFHPFTALVIAISFDHPTLMNEPSRERCLFKVSSWDILMHSVWWPGAQCPDPASTKINGTFEVTIR